MRIIVHEKEHVFQEFSRRELDTRRFLETGRVFFSQFWVQYGTALKSYWLYDRENQKGNDDHFQNDLHPEVSTSVNGSPSVNSNPDSAHNGNFIKNNFGFKTVSFHSFQHFKTDRWCLEVLKLRFTTLFLEKKRRATKFLFCSVYSGWPPYKNRKWKLSHQWLFVVAWT